VTRIVLRGANRQSAPGRGYRFGVLVSDEQIVNEGRFEQPAERPGSRKGARVWEK